MNTLPPWWLFGCFRISSFYLMVHVYRKIGFDNRATATLPRCHEYIGPFLPICLESGPARCSCMLSNWLRSVRLALLRRSSRTVGVIFCQIWFPKSCTHGRRNDCWLRYLPPLDYGHLSSYIPTMVSGLESYEHIKVPCLEY